MSYVPKKNLESAEGLIKPAKHDRYRQDGTESTLTSDSGFGTQTGPDNEQSESEFSLGDELSLPEAILPVEEEKRIKNQVEKELKEEVRKMRLESQAKQSEIRADFKREVNNVRATLIKQRMKAEQRAVAVLEQQAQELEEEVLRKRAERTKQIVKMNSSRRDHNFGAGEEWAKEQMDDMAALRRIHSELERAKARKRVGVGMALVAGKKGKFSLGNLLQTEIRRLERPDEIKKLAMDMEKLGLGTEATQLTATLETREKKDVDLHVTLKEERAKTKAKVEMRKADEVEKVRKVRVSEWDKLEKERKEREEKERLARMMAALKRKARNMEMWRDFDNTLMNSRLSRARSMSYFPPMKVKSGSRSRRASTGGAFKTL